MKLTKETLNILKNFSTLNNGIILKKGNMLITKNITNVVYAEAELNQEIDEEICIYDLQSFLGSINLVGDDADITVGQTTGNIVISSNRITINYPASNSAAIISPKGRVNVPAGDVEYNLPADELKQIMKMARQLSVDRLEFMPLNGRLIIRGWEEVDKEHPNEQFKIDMGEYTGTADFHFYIRMDNMKLMDGDYKISFNRKKIAWFETEHVSYMIACDLQSTFTE